MPPASSTVVDNSSNIPENKSAFAASQICVHTHTSKEAHVHDQQISLLQSYFWIFAVNSYRTDSMTKMKIWGEQEVSVAVSLTCSEKENVADYERFSVTLYRQNCLLFLSSKNCFVLFTNVLAFYLQEMKTVPQSVRKRLREKKNLFSLKQLFFQLLKLLKNSRYYSASFCHWTFGEPTGTHCFPRIPSPEWQWWHLLSLQSKVQIDETVAYMKGELYRDKAWVF